jgi:hypothetical protein
MYAVAMSLMTVLLRPGCGFAVRPDNGLPYETLILATLNRPLAGSLQGFGTAPPMNDAG